MAKVKSTAIYKHPFSRAYWRDAAAEMGSTKMLVITALMTALRIALKPLAIPVGPSLSIQTATLATALGAMIYGPVVAIPAAIVSDTIGFIIYPTGDYFLPFVLTEIAGTMIYALFLYRAKVSPTRVMLARFCICLFVNVVLQQFIYAWYYVYIGNPQSAIKSIMGIMTTSRILKNVVFFPIESVVLTLFLKVLLPVTQRVGLTYCKDADMRITKKQVVALVCLVVVGIASGTAYLFYHYDNTSLSSGYSTEDRMEANQYCQSVVLEESDAWDDAETVTVVESAYKKFLGHEVTYTVAVYEVAEGVEVTDDMWAYSKSPAAKDENLTRAATVTFVANEETGEITGFLTEPAE